MASNLRVDNILPSTGTNIGIGTVSGSTAITGAVTASQIVVGSAVTSNATGIHITGIVTATSFKGDGSTLTGIDATSLKDPGGNVKVQANNSGAVVTGIVTVGGEGAFIGPTSVGLGTTTTAGINAGVGTATGTLAYDLGNGLRVYMGDLSGWVLIKSNISATGGTKTEDGSRTVHTFTSPGTFKVTGGTGLTMNTLVVAGGGAGGSGNWTSGSSGEGAGGGGAGGLRYRSGVPITPGTSYTVTVGTGGAGGNVSDNLRNGNPSWISGISSATGGGMGAWGPDNAGWTPNMNPYPGGGGYQGRAGGSGGGSNGNDNSQLGITLASPDGVSPTAQGNNGGSAGPNIDYAGGGGGAGSAGASAVNSGGAGNGSGHSISGSPYTYSKGGNVNTPYPGNDGVNYGDGGGSSPFGSLGAGAGQDGIVIISWV